MGVFPILYLIMPIGPHAPRICHTLGQYAYFFIIAQESMVYIVGHSEKKVYNTDEGPQTCHLTASITPCYRQGVIGEQ